MPRDRIYWKNVLALAIPLLVFYPRSSQLYISSRSRGSLVIPPFFRAGCELLSNGKLYGQRTHIYAPKRDGSWQQINFHHHHGSCCSLLLSVLLGLHGLHGLLWPESAPAVLSLLMPLLLLAGSVSVCQAGCDVE